MVIGIKDAARLTGMAVITCCAVFVCTLFLNYNIDLVSVEDEILTETGIVMYHAQVSMGKVTAAVTGGCLVVTSVIMLLFYIKNYIDAHGKELGILKALGYSGLRIAKNFWVFGLSVLTGCAAGYVLAFLYLPSFYKKQNAEGYFPDIPVNVHPLLVVFVIGVPAIFFMMISVLYAALKMKTPVLDLLREKKEYKTKTGQKETKVLPFLQELRKITVKGKKTLVFFVAFSAFCFSAMVQMSMSMHQLASETFAFMMITIGLILAYITLFLSLSSVVKGNTKTIAMMRVFGYEECVCSRAILGGYRPISYIGFALGTFYQYGLIKMILAVAFADVEHLPEYRFNVRVLVITFVAFVITYELVMYWYAVRIKRLSIKSVMLE